MLPKSTSIAAISISFFLFIGSFATAFGQTGTFFYAGAVTDENGAVIPNAKLTLAPVSGTATAIQSDDNGRFKFSSLVAGNYRLTVEKAGFATIIREITIGGDTAESGLTMTAGGVDSEVTIVLGPGDAAVESTLKLAVPIHETPRSVTVVGSEQIADRNFRQVSDVLNYVPGMTQNSYRNGSYHFYSRGYRMGPEDTRLDGFAGINVGGGGFGASTFGIEEIVVLRGPTSLVYGSTGSPGGFINMVSKKPREEYFSRLDLRTGGFSGAGIGLRDTPTAAVDFDSTGPIPWTDRILYRALVTVENSSYHTRDTLDRNRYANLSATIRLDKFGRYLLTPSAQITRYNRPYGGGIVISPSTSLRTNDGLREINRDDLSPLDVNLSAGRRIEKTAWAGFDFRGAPTDRLRLNGSYRYVSFDTDINSFTPQVTSNAQILALQTRNVVSRIQAKSLTFRNYHNLSADAAYEIKANGWIRSTIQAGFYERVLDSRTSSASGAIPAASSPINIYTGVSESPLVDRFPSLVLSKWGRDIVWNAFVQNRTSLANGRWHITLGANYGQVNPASGTTRKSDIMPNAAVLFNATPQLAVYASYSTSFNPSDPELEDATGNRAVFEPAIGRNFEAGAKYDLLSRRMNLAFSVFQNQIDNALVQSDVNVLNPRGNRFYVAAGTRRARGAEMTAEFQVRPELRISASASYLDAIYRGVPAGLTVSGLPPSTSPIPGSRAEKSPRWSYSAYARYDRREGALKGFGAGLGVVFQGKRIGSNGAQTFAAPDPLILPDFYRVDAALYYRLNKFVNFGVNIDNVFNQLIFVNASVGSSIEVAAPRSVIFKTTFNF